MIFETLDVGQQVYFLNGYIERGVIVGINLNHFNDNTQILYTIWCNDVEYEKTNVFKTKEELVKFYNITLTNFEKKL